MPLLTTKSAKIHRPPFLPLQAARSDVVHTHEVETTGGFQIVPLDQLKVVEGVFRAEQIQSAEDLCLGDAFKFFKPDQQFHADCRVRSGTEAVEVMTASRFGVATFTATVTHSVVLMSETGQQATGYVLDGSRNASQRPSIILCGETDPAAQYSLIEITEGRKSFGWTESKERSDANDIY